MPVKLEFLNQSITKFEFSHLERTFYIIFLIDNPVYNNKKWPYLQKWYLWQINKIQTIIKIKVYSFTKIQSARYSEALLNSMLAICPIRNAAIVTIF